ncbi:MAG: hypothetical protein MJ158_03825, partial [Alphaproteobacteria bacterium]|nr:hypothetical protein [Alphaproteobacteria bacterium]
MAKNKSEEDVFLLTKVHDDKNIYTINSAYETGKIDKTTKDYLDRLYTNSMDLCRDVFLCIGKCFGAPKAPVMMYDYETDSAIEKPITIYSINPLSPYIVHHRLDADPMRNQFFTSSKGHKIDLSVSSIVTVIVGAQKSINRALDKVTGKYYTEYVNEIKDAAYNIISESANVASAQAIVNKIDSFFTKDFYTDASE